MIITIVQAEIESAIRNYINDQINIREGQSVSIELQATRGSEGFRAIIDITTVSPVKLASVQSQQVAELNKYVQPTYPGPISTAPKVPQTPAEVRQVMAAQYAAEDAAETASETVLSTDTVTAINEVTETRLADAGFPTSDDTTTTTANEASIVKPTSLFKNLRKPVNA